MQCAETSFIKKYLQQNFICKIALNYASEMGGIEI